MTDERAPSYWLFQANPKVFRLRDALRSESLFTAPVKSHVGKIKKGDKVILWQSGKQAGCYGLATVNSAAKKMELLEKEKVFYREAPQEVKRVELDIDINLWNKPITKEILPNSKAFEEFYAGIPGTNFKAKKEHYLELKSLVERMDIAYEPAVEYYSLSKSPHPLNLILFGPPGTGKTFHTVDYALSIIEQRSLSELVLESRESLRERFDSLLKKDQIQMVTFHQSFAYEDFMEGIKPQIKEGQVVYEVENGLFKNICLKAKKAWEDSKESKTIPDKYVFIIDEINRGNVASIFGELITLIEADKRMGNPEALQVILPYSKESFSIPPNLHLLATMNTTDRSVETLDLALRRRFNFIPKLPAPSLIPTLAKKPVAAGVDLEKLLKAINQRIEVLIGKEYGIGHSYFLNIETLKDIKEVFSKKIIPLLQEYFFNDLGKIGLILGDQFIKERTYEDADVFANFEHEMANEWAEKRIYVIVDLSLLSAEAFIKIYHKDYES